MADPRTDRIAREAARLIQTGRADAIGDAIRIAADLLGLHGAPLPGHVRVRQHARAMSMQAMGEQAYRESIREMWRIAEELMTALEQAMPDAPSLLVGRAAQGYIDAGVTIHIRLYTRESPAAIAAALAEFGYEDPEFETAETPYGRLSQLRFVEDDLEIVLTRCMPELVATSNVDLFSGRPIETLDLSALRQRLVDEADRGQL